MSKILLDYVINIEKVMRQLFFFTKSLKSDMYFILTAQFNSYLPHFKTHITNGHDIEQSSFCTFSENNLCH